MSRAVIGVDVGTGAARACALDGDGHVLARSQAGYRDAELWPSGRGDARAWLDAVVAAVREVHARLPSGTSTAALAIGGQSPTTVAAEGGMAVTVGHPAGLDLEPNAQHLAQQAILETERGQTVRPYQLWDWMLERFGADPHQGRWPGDRPLGGRGPVCPTGDVVGVGRSEEATGITLVAGAQDAYLALWAAGVDTAGRSLDPGGRTGGLAVAVPAGVRVEGLWTAASAARGVDIAGGPVSAHGLALEWVSRLVDRPIDVLLEMAAGVPPGSSGVVVLPYLNGERAPRWNAALRGEIVGVGEQTSPAVLARAVLEGTAYGLGHIAAVLRESNAPLNTLICAGSPSRSRLWCEIKAAVLEVPVDVPVDADLAAFGAALAAGAGVGWWPKPGAGGAGDWPRPAMQRIEAEPRPEYREGLRRFIALGDEAEARSRQIS